MVCVCAEMPVWLCVGWGGNEGATPTPSTHQKLLKGVPQLRDELPLVTPLRRGYR